MAIRRVWVKIVPYELPPGLFNPLQRWDSQQRMPVIGVEDDEGRTGIAQCMAPSDAVSSVAENLFGPVLLEQDPRRIRGLWDRMYARTVLAGGRGLAVKVLGAIDIALWDLWSQAVGQPIHHLLGGCRASVPVYASAGLYGTDKTVGDLAAEMRGYVERGFKAVKMKVAGAALAEDVERVRAVRAAIGAQTKLMIDASYVLTAKQAIRLEAALAPYDIEFLEAPVPVENVDQLRQVTRAVRTPVAGNELGSTRFAFRALIEGRCVDIVQPNVTTTGGITETLRVIATAETFGLPCSLQASGELELLASVHLAAAHACVTSVEVHMMHRYLPPALADAVLRLVDGALVAPQHPGLGFPSRAEVMGALGLA